MMNWNIPNILTWLRISLIPIFVLTFYWPFAGHYWVSSGVFGLAALTDWLDGYLARKLQQVSSFGEFLDPVADKLMVAVALVCLVQAYPSVSVAIAAAIIVSREIVISALREWMSELGKRKRLVVKGIGKIKTVAQMLAIVLLLAFKTDSHHWLQFLGYILLYIAALLTLWSMIVYLKIAAEEFR